MFQIKICGITTPADALLAADLGADAIGLNFYENSPRFVAPDVACDISAAVSTLVTDANQLRLIGVFVNSVIDENTETQFISAITGFQYHGDESPCVIATQCKMAQILAGDLPKELSPEWLLEKMHQKLPSPPKPAGNTLVIKAFRAKENSLESVADYLRECAGAGALPHAILLDAHAPGAYGGTGQTLDWNMIRDQRDKLLGLPLILAGGLTPDNVAAAIRTARPDAVDVASGVESSPGKKDPAKLRDFIAAAKAAFAALARSATEK